MTNYEDGRRFECVPLRRARGGGRMSDWDPIVGTCDWGTCGRWADSLRFDDRLGCLVPVCWRHITAYRIGKGNTGLWQAEDEFAGLRFCRRSRWRWLAQRRILADQRAAMAGRMSRAQARRWKRADA